MNNSVKSAQNSIVGNTSFPVSGVEVIGTGKDENGKECIIAKGVGDQLDKAFRIPISGLIPGNGKDNSNYLIGKNIHAVISVSPAMVQQDIINQWNKKKSKNILFFNKPGTFQCSIGSEEYFIIVINGNYFSDKPLPESVTVILVEEAKINNSKKESYQGFINELSEKLSVLPRVLLVVVFALASYWWPVFRVPPLALMLVGRTSTGKSVSQALASQLVKGTKQMISGNFTAIGLHEELANQGTQPVFIEDGHGKTVAQAMLSAFMDAGNGAHRIRSKKTQYRNDPQKPVTSTLIVSAEQNISTTAKQAKLVLMPGVISRVVEVLEGEFGMFDNLCGFEDGASLAVYLSKAGAEHPGVLGELVVKSICEDFELYKSSWENRKSIIRGQIIQHLEIEGDWDGQDNRLFDGLVFCAYIGQIAIKNNHLQIKNRHINKAFAKIFSEYLFNKYTGIPEAAEEIRFHVKTVRAAIFDNIDYFKKMKNEEKLQQYLKNPFVLGFYVEEKHGEYYLFKPEAFEEIIGDVLTRRTYENLKVSGFLKVSPNRGYQYQKRLPDGSRMSFVAISANILD